MTLEDKIIQILETDNPGLLPDEARREAASILYRKDIYEKARIELETERMGGWWDGDERDKKHDKG